MGSVPKILAGGYVKILLVEDNVPICECYQLFLTEEHEVLVATSIRDALVLLRSNPDINIVVLDGLVPQYAGETKLKKTVELLGRIKLVCPKTVVIAASSEDSLNKELLTSGALYSIANKSTMALQEVVARVSSINKLV